MTRTSGTLLALCLAAAPLTAGTLVQDQTARATGVAGAYVAQVDDPTAIFYNPGALGLLKKKKGVALNTTSTSWHPFQFQGRAPGSGAGTIGEMKSTYEFLPGAFATLPVAPKLVMGIGAFTSMQMHSDWDQPDAFSGRFFATKSTIDAYDATTTFGLQLSPTLGIGGGAVYRTAKLALDRHYASTVSGVFREFGASTLETDTKSALGWNAGLAFRPSPKFSFGASYRSPMTFDFEGASTLTQIATGDTQFDQLIRASLPFGQSLPIVSRFRTPAQYDAGIAFTAGEPLLLEFDVNRIQWKRVESIAFVYPTAASLDASYPLNFKNITNYRAGLRFQFPTGPVVRLGYSVEKSPQPDETISPFLADLDRNTITFGFGMDWLDVAFGYTSLGERAITNNTNGFNGNYSGNVWTVAITATK